MIFCEAIDDYGIVQKLLGEAEIEVQFDHNGKKATAYFDISGGDYAPGDRNNPPEYVDPDVEFLGASTEDDVEIQKTEFDYDKIEDEAVEQYWHTAYEFEKEPDDVMFESAEYKGKKVELKKPFRTGDGKSKFAVYVKNPKTDNVVKVRFGDPEMEIKRDDPEARKNFRARHNCDDAKDPLTAKYWSCRFWSNKSVSDLLK